MTLVERIREGMDLSRRIVEIGPLYRPFVRKAEGNVVYVDHADTATLREKYRDDPKFDVADIVEVDAVWGGKTLAECIGEHAGYIIASHVIEHVPDLITWLGELSEALVPGGQIRLVIPDKRFTFDYLRRTTELADVLDAFLRKTRAPLPRCILDHVLNVRNVDTRQAWAGPLDPQKLDRPPGHGYALALGTARDALETAHYHDVHCWVFTPRSFAQLMHDMAEQGLHALKCVNYIDTRRDELEFVTFVQPCADPAEVIASWVQARDHSAPEGHLELTQLRSRVEREQQQAGRCFSELTAASARLAEAERALEVAQERIHSLEGSHSWRLTAPLRAMRRIARGE